MTSRTDLPAAARASMISIALSAAAITIDHYYVLGAGALALGALLVVLPSGLLWWFVKRGSIAALAGYTLINLWIVVGFGILKGL